VRKKKETEEGESLLTLQKSRFREKVSQQKKKKEKREVLSGKKRENRRAYGGKSPFKGKCGKKRGKAQESPKKKKTYTGGSGVSSHNPGVKIPEKEVFLYKMAIGKRD